MRELPILFNTEMVQALLDGRKTVTRRIVKPQPPEVLGVQFYGLIDNVARFSWDKSTALCDRKCHYQPGDRLWVQETWKIDSLLRDRPDYPMAIDFKAVQSGYNQAEIMCKFTPDRFDKFKKFYQKNGWQSPYFMPKEAARIWLEVTNVRVERLQEITVEDVISEGLEADNEIRNPDPSTHESIKNWNLAWAQHVFRELWDKLNLKRGYSWDANPWVWVIEFRRVE